MNCFACTKDPISLSSFSPFVLVSCILGEDRGAEFPAAEDGVRPERRPRRKERKSTAVHRSGAEADNNPRGLRMVLHPKPRAVATTGGPPREEEGPGGQLREEQGPAPGNGSTPGWSQQTQERLDEHREESGRRPRSRVWSWERLHL